MQKKPLIGVLAVQGDFAAHRAAFARLGCETVEVRKSVDLEPADGLILPGGETTTLIKILRETGLWEGILSFAGEGRPLFGTCAGLILLAREVTDPPQSSLGLLDVTVQRNAYGRQVDSFEVTGVLRVPTDLRTCMRRNGVPPDTSGGDAADEAVGGTARAGTAAKITGTGTADKVTGTGAAAKVTGTEGADKVARAELATEFVFIRAPKILSTDEEVEVLARHDGNPILVRQGHILGASFHPELASQGAVERLFLAMLARAGAAPAGEVVPASEVVPAGEVVPASEVVPAGGNGRG